MPYLEVGLILVTVIYDKMKPCTKFYKEIRDKLVPLYNNVRVRFVARSE